MSSSCPRPRRGRPARSSASIPISRTSGTSTSPSPSANSEPSAADLKTHVAVGGPAAPGRLRRQLLPPVRQRRRAAGPGPGARARPARPCRSTSITRAVPGYPIDDEEYRGLFIHRWIRTVDRGPLFGLSFVAGVITGTSPIPRASSTSSTRTRGCGRPWPRDWPARSSRASPRSCSRPARATTARPTSCAGPADRSSLRQIILRQHGLRGDLGRDRAPVASTWVSPPDGCPDGQRRRRRPFPPRSQRRRVDAAAPAARRLHRPAPSPEEPPAPARGLDRRRPADRRRT